MIVPKGVRNSAFRHKSLNISAKKYAEFVKVAIGSYVTALYEGLQYGQVISISNALQDAFKYGKPQDDDEAVALVYIAGVLYGTAQQNPGYIANIIHRLNEHLGMDITKLSGVIPQTIYNGVSDVLGVDNSWQELEALGKIEVIGGGSSFIANNN